MSCLLRSKNNAENLQEILLISGKAGFDKNPHNANHKITAEGSRNVWK